MIILKILLTILFCIYVSITDIRNGMIPNLAVLSTAIAGIILTTIEWFLDPNIFIPQSINIVAIIALSLILYLLRIWAAGDCKMMIVLAFLIPYSMYSYSYFSYIPLLIVPVIAFGVSFIYLLFDSIICHIKGVNKHVSSDYRTAIRTTVVNWLACTVFVFLADYILEMLKPDLFENYSWLLICINITIVMIVSGVDVFKNRIILICSYVVAIVIAVISKIGFINWKMAPTLILIIFITMLRSFIDNYNYSLIETDKLKKGMILSTGTTMLFINSKIHNLPEQSYEDLRSRLSEEEVDAVKRWCNKKGITNVYIVRKMPFAIFLSLGVLFVLWSNYL